MKMLGFIKRSVLTKVFIQIAHMVGNNIHHYENISFMTLVNKINEILFSPKIII